jgi:hypothetical protein
MLQPIWLWCARLAWFVLPITVGSALADGLDGWSTGASVVAAALCWAAWATGLLALLAPRPWGLTFLRAAAPITVALALVAVPATSTGTAMIAIASSLLSAILVLGAPVAFAAANSLAYGDEVRFSLRVPSALFLGPIPFATALAGAGVATGPILLGDGRIPAGIVVTIVGVPVAYLCMRALDALSRRWFVLVPAGIAIVDALTLLDPVLLKRDAIEHLQPAAGTAASSGALDLRLGAIAGGVQIDLADAVTFGRRRGRAGGELLEPKSVVVSVVQRETMLAHARERRIPT